MSCSSWTCCCHSRGTTQRGIRFRQRGMLSRPGSLACSRGRAGWHALAVLRVSMPARACSHKHAVSNTLAPSWRKRNPFSRNARGRGKPRPLSSRSSAPRASVTRRPVENAPEVIIMRFHGTRDNTRAVPCGSAQSVESRSGTISMPVGIAVHPEMVPNLRIQQKKTRSCVRGAVANWTTWVPRHSTRELAGVSLVILASCSSTRSGSTCTAVRHAGESNSSWMELASSFDLIDGRRRRTWPTPQEQEELLSSPGTITAPA